MDSDPIEQGSGYSRMITLYVLGPTPAFMIGISKIPARTWVHCNFFTKPKIKYTIKRPRALPEGYPMRPKTIGECMRKRRIDLGLFQKDVARVIGVDVNTITLWKKGRYKPSRGCLGRVEGFLGS